MVSVDGAHVYALGRADDAIVVFNRNSSDGVLSFDTALTKSTPDFIGLSSPNAIITNPTDDRIYVLGFDDSTMVSFARDNLTTSNTYGNLEFADLEQDEVSGVTKMNGPTSLAVTSNGSWVIVTSGIDNALVVFKTHIPEPVSILFADGFE